MASYSFSFIVCFPVSLCFHCLIFTVSLLSNVFGHPDLFVKNMPPDLSSHSALLLFSLCRVMFQLSSPSLFLTVFVAYSYPRKMSDERIVCGPLCFRCIRLRCCTKKIGVAKGDSGLATTLDFVVFIIVV